MLVPPLGETYWPRLSELNARVAVLTFEVNRLAAENERLRAELAAQLHDEQDGGEHDEATR